jgi:NADP-dependent 3-hydroxy acid dehydrogenase YdfG
MKETRTIAIVGGGELANHIKSSANNRQVDIIGHNEFDITNQSQCDFIVPKLATYDAVIVTSGKYTDDIWDMWLVNTVGPCYLIAKLNAVAEGQRIIAISSHGASWTSWPGIPTYILSYNTNKSALNTFLTGLVQQDNSTNNITVFEPSKFKSHMSNHHGASPSDVAQQVLEVIDSPMHIAHIIVKDL